MNFDEVLKQLFEKAVACFNSGDYDTLKDTIARNAELISEEFKTSNFFAPAIHAKNRGEIFEYWKTINAEFDNSITQIEYLQTGKHCIVRCTYDSLGIIVDSHIEFDEYGIVYKMVNEFAGEVRKK